MDIVDDVSNLIEATRIENYNQFNNETTKIGFVDVLNNYLQKILKYKAENYGLFKEKAQFLSERIVEHLTGDYKLGLGESFEKIDGTSETFSSIIAYSDNQTLVDILENDKENELAEVIVDGSLGLGLISCNENETVKQNAQESYRQADDRMKSFFNNAIDNIIHLNRTLANTIANLTKMDSEESKGLNENILGKFIGGIGYELISGTLISKRHFTLVENSKSMQENIKENGILHFTSPSNVQKIIDSGKIKKSSVLISDMTAPKCFFFAGVPTFEDLLINIPAYDVMTAIRIRPTEEQMKDLKYRALNDRAVVKDGDFKFSDEQVDIAYFGLMYDKEKDSIYLGELTKEEAENFQVCEEVRNAYNYSTGKNSIINNVKMNAYGLYAEYRHHQKLLLMEQQIKEAGFKNFRNVNDEVLVELSDIQEAYISTREKSVERKNMFQKIKSRIESQKLMKNQQEIMHTNDIEKEESEDERNI